MSLVGTNYKNFIGNFILILPILAYTIYNEIKKRKITYITITTCLTTIFIIILFILYMTHIMSSYYYNKIYNLLWLLSFIYLIEVIYNNKERFLKLYLYSYIIIAILACIRVENIINKYNDNISTNTVISNVGDVYDTNVRLLQKENKTLDYSMYELLEHLKENKEEYMNDRGEIPFIADYFKKIWITQILDIIVSNNYGKKSDTDTYYADTIFEVSEDDTVKYLVWIPDDTNKKDMGSTNYKIIYRSKLGFILKKV